MILNLTKGFVPEAYSDSRDYRVLLKLASVLLSVLRDNIGSIPTLYSADDCPKEMLYLLSDMVGYDYAKSASTRSIESSRTIVKYFPHLLRYRGSRAGIEIAAALSLNSMDESPEFSLDSLVVDFDYENGVVKIYYPRPDALDMNLIEAVRPVGTRIELVTSVVSNRSDELDVKVTASKVEEAWTEDRVKVGKSKVGFGDTGATSDKGGN